MEKVVSPLARMLLAGAWVIASCSGEIVGNEGDDVSAQSGPPAGGGSVGGLAGTRNTMGPSAGAPAGAVPPGVGGAGAPALLPNGTVAGTHCAQLATLPPARIWRLSPRQYANTAKQVFGVALDVTGMPADPIKSEDLTQFNTGSDYALVDDRLAVSFADHASTLATAVAANPPAGLGCINGTPDEACLQSFFGNVAGRAFRRPVQGPELGRLTAFAKTNATKFGAPAAVRMTLEAIFQSPHFLYRTELGETQGARVVLTQHELASQLSYFLTDGPPDVVLLQAADKGELATSLAVRTHAQRLLATAAARPKVRDFFLSYLSLGSVGEGDGGAPALAPELKRALVEETTTFIDKVLFENKGSLETLYNADYSYHNALTAKHYGTQATGAGWARTVLPKGRAGLLSHAAVLVAISGGAKTSPVHRGLHFSQTMLCRTLPPAPPDVSNMADRLTDPANPKGTERHHWNYFAKTSPACAGCHAFFQPLGLSLENFDSVGRYRTTENGSLIDPSATLSGYGADLDGPYSDGVALGRAVAASKQGRECFALQYLTFAFGRSVDAQGDKCRIEAMGQRLKDSNFSLQELLVSMTQDESFYFRTYQDAR